MSTGLNINYSITANTICSIEDFDISIVKIVGYSQMLYFTINFMKKRFLAYIELARYIFFGKK